MHVEQYGLQTAVCKSLVLHFRTTTDSADKTSADLAYMHRGDDFVVLIVVCIFAW